MSIIPKESIAAVAEANGIQINDQVALSVSADVEYRLREIIVEAKKFMKHFKRSYLKPEDLNYALKVKNMEPMYGYNNWTPKMWKNTEHSGQQLFFLEDQEVDLDQIIHQKLPLVPLDVMYSSHWLAIEGVQPAIPQNPTPSEIAAMKDEFTVKLNPAPIIETSVEKKKDDKPSLVYNPMAKAKDKLVKDVLSKELILYYEKITHAILLIENKTTKAIKAGQVVIPSRSNMANGTQSNLLNLSRFKDECIDGVSKDPALQPLAPYFVEFLTQSVHENMKHVDILMNLMKFAKALLDNPNIFIEPYLHHLIPNVLTCTMAKKFSKSPKHWELRDYSAKLLGIIVKRHGAKYGDLSSRLSKKLIRCIFEVMVSSQEGSFEQGQGWSGCFGCVLGLAAISDYAVRALLLPKISLLGEAIEQDLKYGDKINDDAMEVDNEAAKPEKSGAEHEALKLRRAEAERCFDCVVNVIIPHVHEDLLKKNDIAVPTTDSKVNKNEKYLIKGLEADKKDEIVQKLMKDYGNVFAECLINRLGLD